MTLYGGLQLVVRLIHEPIGIDGSHKVNLAVVTQDLGKGVELVCSGRDVREARKNDDAPNGILGEVAANDLKGEQSQKLAAELIAFFEGLDKAVSEKSGDCPAVSDALRDYYAAHKEWIDSLDYVSVDIDAQAVDTIHNMAIELGKKLSACYDQKTIPELLKRFSKR